MSKLIAFVSTFCLVFLIIGLVVYARVYAPGGTWLRPVDAPAVVNQIHGLQELVVVRYAVQRAIRVGEPPVVVLVQGRAQAAVDLASVTQYDVEVVGKKIRVRLPRARITGITVDQKSIHLLDGRAPDPDVQRKAAEAAIDDIRQAVVGMGILADAEAAARTAVRGLVGAMGDTVEVTSAAALPVPDPPGPATVPAVAY
jgi:hypothetical protein